jgi:NAD-dependent deacetylase
MSLQNVHLSMFANERAVIRRSNAPCLTLVDANIIPPVVERDVEGDVASKKSEHRQAMPITPDALRKALLDSTHVVALTGSGISVLSGLRPHQDLWQDPTWNRDLCVSSVGFAEKPEALWHLVQSFLSDAGPQFQPIPNACHHALAALQKQGLLQGIVTQNVDGLHQKAGSGNVIELHGSLCNRTYCRECGIIHEPPASWLRRSNVALPPKCASCDGIVRPDVVLFGETVPDAMYTAAKQLLEPCDLLLVLGTACDVAPSSLFVQAVSKHAHVFELALKPSLLTSTCVDAYHHGPDGAEFLSAVAKQ